MERRKLGNHIVFRDGLSRAQAPSSSTSLRYRSWECRKRLKRRNNAAKESAQLSQPVVLVSVKVEVQSVRKIPLRNPSKHNIAPAGDARTAAGVLQNQTRTRRLTSVSSCQMGKCIAVIKPSRGSNQHLAASSRLRAVQAKLKPAQRDVLHGH